jgi:hypothetical protein
MHPRRRLGATVAAALLLCSSLAAADPVSLVARLGSPRSGERDTAARDLEALGAAALPRLRQARQSDDAEVRRRARLLVQTIERRLQADSLLQPGRVHLVYDETPLREAAADLGRRTGFIVRLEGATDRTITLDTGAVSPWEAVARFVRAAELTEPPASPGTLDLSNYDPWDRKVLDLDDLRSDSTEPASRQLVLRAEESAALPTFQRGALRLRALPPDAKPTAAGETIVQLEVRLEPRLRLQAVLAVRIDRAIDDEGRMLTQPVAGIAGAGALAGGPNDEVFVVWNGETSLPADLPNEAGPVPVRLRLTGQPSKQLKALHGTLAFQLQTPGEPLATVDGLNAPGKTVRGRDGSVVRILEVRRDPFGLLRLRVEVTPAPCDLFVAGVPARILLVNTSRWRGRGLPVPPLVAADQLRLFDDRGRRHPLADTPVPTVGSNGTSWDFTLLLRPRPDGGEPTRLVYVGRHSATVEVPFTLQDVPLP